MQGWTSGKRKGHSGKEGHLGAGGKRLASEKAGVDSLKVLWGGGKQGETRLERSVLVVKEPFGVKEKALLASLRS